MSPLENLKNLKNHLKEQTISLMVGSGMSKNVSPEFPSWPELLSDMAAELFEKEIDQAINQLPTVAVPSDLIKFRRGLILTLMQQHGYLRIVTDYIAKHGYREIVEIYIEERIPRIIKTNGKTKLSFQKNGQQINQELFAEDFLVPQNLLELPWTNVFTTNFDDVLENCVDINQFNKSAAKIVALLEDLNQLKEAESGYLSETETIDAQIDELWDRSKSKVTANQLTAAEPSSKEGSQAQDRLKELQNQKGQIAGKIYECRQGIKGLENEIENEKELKRKSWTWVDHSANLIIKRNKNLIKLHGTLREKGNRRFGFDNDPSICYIIEANDYEEYPQKHEAFTQLMRISLLQDAFCMIGFSGDDPNFLSWIKWVRNVVEKGSSNGRDDKIFYVDIENKPLSSGKEQFFYNHRIAHIPLYDKDILDFLNVQTKSHLSPSSSPKEVLMQFLRYLGQDLAYNDATIAVWRQRLGKYEAVWRKIAPHSFNDLKPDNILKNIDQLLELKNDMVVSSVEFQFESSRTITCQSAVRLLNKCSDVTQRKAVLQLLVLAIEELHLPWKNLFLPEDFDIVCQSAREFPEIDSALKVSAFKQAVLENDLAQLALLNVTDQEHKDDLKDVYIQFQIYHHYINLRYSDARALLDSWSPASDLFSLIKAGLLAPYDKTTALIILKSIHPQNPQLFFHKLLLERYIVNSQHHTDRQEDPRLEELRLSKADIFERNVDYLMETVMSEKKVFEPIGDKKFNTSRSYGSSGDTKAEASIQFFTYLIDYGFPLCLQRYPFRNLESVLPLSLRAIAHYPGPVLNSLIHYHSVTKFRLLGQTVAVDPDCSTDREIWIENLSDAVRRADFPYPLQSSVLAFFSELLITLNPDLWEPAFRILWMNNSGLLFENIRQTEIPFIHTGLKLIKDPSLIGEIVTLFQSIHIPKWVYMM